MKRYLLAASCGVMLLMPFQAVKAQGPVAGQPYQVPEGYGGYAAGTVINYGGFNYVLQGDATMILADQPADASPPAGDSGPGQAYQVPDGYGGYAAGTVISYGGASYVLQGNGTMLVSDQGGDGPQGGGQVYQIPAGYGGYATGTVIDYGGSNYTIGLNGTMVLVTSGRYTSNYRSPGSTSRPVLNSNPTRPAWQQGNVSRPWQSQPLSRQRPGQLGGAPRRDQPAYASRTSPSRGLAAATNRPNPGRMGGGTASRSAPARTPVRRGR